MFKTEICVYCKKDVIECDKPIHYDNDSNPWCHVCWCKKWYVTETMKETKEKGCYGCIHIEVCDIYSALFDVIDEHAFCKHEQLFEFISNICNYYLIAPHDPKEEEKS